MTHEHPLERLLRDTKEKDDLAAAAWAEEQRKALALREQVSQQWGRTKADLLREIDRANSVLEKYGLRERFGTASKRNPDQVMSRAATWRWHTLQRQREPSTIFRRWRLTVA